MGVLSVLNNLTSKTFLFSSLLLTTILCNTSAVTANVDSSESVEKQQLPFCGEKLQRDIGRRLLYVTTLDGQLSALDISQGGALKWSIPTGPGPLLSSSIHRLELTNNGQWVRMIPSLSGTLYKFDGENVEGISITADTLLSSSFKFSDDLVISGGKETRYYGVSARTGQLLYESSMNGNYNHSESSSVNEEATTQQSEPDLKQIDPHDPLLDDVLIIRRQTQTVRAVEPRTGVERWNFSVGHHELDWSKSEDCHSRPETDSDKSILDLEMKVVVPEGIVCAINKKTNTMIWKHKFDYPIVSAWQADKDQNLKSVDLFNSAQWLWNIDRDTASSNSNSLAVPSVYVGMFNKQLYIQESDKLKKLLIDQTHSPPLSNDLSNYPRIPWKPYPAASSALMLIDDKSNKELTFEDAGSAVTALSVLYASEYVNGNGFYLFSEHEENGTLCDNKNGTIFEDLESPDDEYEIPVKIKLVSLWYWWKEILVISLTSALLLNMFLNNRRHTPKEREVVVVERHVEIPVPMEMNKKNDSRGENILNNRSSQRSISESNSENFTSRFIEDFDLMQCLGRGGFGVVFEAKNKIDDCRYAIKRIILPSKQESRDRVMREVKTLANCEHQNIVRYFQAWVETPPPGWQETQDKIWMEKEALSTSIDIDSPSELSSLPNHKIKDIFMNRNKVKKLDSWITNLNTNECINFDSEIRKTKFIKTNSNNITDDSSYIQFKIDSHSDNSASDSDVFSASNDANRNYHNGYDEGNDDDDSFQIMFQHSLNNNNNNNNNNMKSRSNCNQNNNDNVHVISMTSTNSNSRNTKDDSDSHTSNKKLALPLKRKHRRPLSLDLSSRGNVIPSLLNNRMYLFIQMQLCQKQSLKDWLKLTDLASRQRQIVPIFEQIVGAVEYVHLKGLIHRDLKPSNIFFSLDGQIKIGDFGLVTDMADIPLTPCDETEPSFVSNKHKHKHTQQVGTHLYMSPEQLQGRAYNYKVDIYSLGLILFELLIVFSTEMERIETLKGLRMNKFPDDFQNSFNKENELLKLMLSQLPNERPTTFGIRARPPLEHKSVSPEWHFELPPRRRDSRTSNTSTSSLSKDSGSN